MSAPIDRRRFLGLLAGLGVGLKLSGPAIAAPREEVEQAWKLLAQAPVIFLVDRAGSITREGDREPEIQGDVYDIDTGQIDSVEALIDEIDSRDELRSFFQDLAAEAHAALLDRVDGRPAAADARKTKAILAALADPDDGWQDWIRLEGESRLAFFTSRIDAWLAMPVNWLRCEFWPPGWSNQERCMHFFAALNTDILARLGVEIVEGEHPASSYYAAELTRDVADANAAAAQLDLPFRFRRTI